MRFPFSLTRSMAGYLMRQRLAGRRRFPLVLMLEPLEACNLRCAGCGRIREFAGAAQARLSLDECLAAVDECGAPVVTLCGGEPLLYQGVEELTERIIARRKHVYLCTNGLLLEGKLAGFRPSDRLFLNVHLDGMEASHDRLVGRQGVFATAVSAIRAAKRAGFMVCTNTTVYRQTEMNEIVVLFEYLAQLGVDGMMISPGYSYQSVQQSDPAGADALFLSREMIHAKFREAASRLRGFRLVASPVYLEMLCGKRQLPCAAWANPTRTIHGWKGPCYLITDRHYPSFAALMAETAWDRLGPGNDPRCEHCLVHSGFEPAAVLAANRRLRDALRMAVWQMT